eukprot:TRINITY_DN2499_c0_g1_i1.p1 TRINITY_DN2499_c0_g1~~TRINITY_DN2499_c0_g1_i1.p1  ORF type:complete len:341 (+),score=46.33 TRINITY_DN2499_c0_g1_i1:149-1171(+)
MISDLPEDSALYSEYLSKVKNLGDEISTMADGTLKSSQLPLDIDKQIKDKANAIIVELKKMSQKQKSEAKIKKRLASTKLTLKATEKKFCFRCKTNTTPEWRRGPDGPRTLCNACGLKEAKRCKLNRQSYSFPDNHQMTNQYSPTKCASEPSTPDPSSPQAVRSPMISPNRTTQTNELLNNNGSVHQADYFKADDDAIFREDRARGSSTFSKWSDINSVQQAPIPVSITQTYPSYGARTAAHAIKQQNHLYQPHYGPRSFHQNQNHAVDQGIPSIRSGSNPGYHNSSHHLYLPHGYSHQNHPPHSSFPSEMYIGPDHCYQYDTSDAPYTSSSTQYWNYND